LNRQIDWFEQPDLSSSAHAQHFSAMSAQIHHRFPTAPLHFPPIIGNNSIDIDSLLILFRFGIDIDIDDTFKVGIDIECQQHF